MKKDIDNHDRNYQCYYDHATRLIVIMKTMIMMMMIALIMMKMMVIVMIIMTMIVMMMMMMVMMVMMMIMMMMVMMKMTKNVNCVRLFFRISTMGIGKMKIPWHDMKMT